MEIICLRELCEFFFFFFLMCDTLNVCISIHHHPHPLPTKESHSLTHQKNRSNSPRHLRRTRSHLLHLLSSDTFDRIDSFLCGGDPCVRVRVVVAGLLVFRDLASTHCFFQSTGWGILVFWGMEVWGNSGVEGRNPVGRGCNLYVRFCGLRDYYFAGIWNLRGFLKCT